VGFGIPTAVRAETGPVVGLLPHPKQEGGEAFSHGLWSRGAHEKRWVQGPQDLWNGPHRRAEYRRAASERLDGDEAESFEFPRREDEQIGRLVVAGQIRIGQITEEPHVVPKPERLRELFELFSTGSGASNGQQEFRDRMAQARQGADQGIKAHAGFEVTDAEQQWSVKGEVESAAQRFLGGGRLEAIQICSSGDELEAVGGDSVQAPELVGREAAQDADSLGGAETGTLHPPQQSLSAATAETAAVQAGHSGAGGILQWGRGQKIIEAGGLTGGRDSESPAPG
jgi:hypothetical protein